MEKDNWVEVMRDLQGYLKPEQMKHIYNSCENIRDKVLIRVLWKSGRRITEVLMLKVSDINFDDRNIVWNIEKKKKPMKKLKPIDDFTIRLLKFYTETGKFNPTDYVFQSPMNLGKPITRQRAFQIVRRSCEKAGIYNIGSKRPHPHHFRHSFAVDISKRAKSPSDIKKLQMLLEHTSLNTTESYLQFGSEDLRELIEDPPPQKKQNTSENNTSP
jgi:site-specific recombinase XerD